MLEMLRSCGLVIAGPDHPVLRYLELRRHVRALPLYDPRSGKPTMARAWQITDVGIAAALKLALPVSRKRRGRPEAEQTDIEDALKNLDASASSGGEPDAAPLTVPDAPAVPAAGVSAPKAAQSRQALAADKPEPAHV